MLSNELFPRFDREVLSSVECVFPSKGFFISHARCFYWPACGKEMEEVGVSPQSARGDVLATQQRPGSAVFLVKEEEGIVRKYKTSPRKKKKKINQRANQTAFDFDDCHAFNISR